ncbi:MAG: hypothetical protein K6D02_05895 [Lachnospiraceae bacterium]|nr:hypothetical protein [Lachnospiraceae bacterium]
MINNKETLNRATFRGIGLLDGVTRVDQVCMEVYYYTYGEITFIAPFARGESPYNKVLISAGVFGDEEGDEDYYSKLIDSQFDEETQEDVKIQCYEITGGLDFSNEYEPIIDIKDVKVLDKSEVDNEIKRQEEDRIKHGEAKEFTIPDYNVIRVKCSAIGEPFIEKVCERPLKKSGNSERDVTKLDVIEVEVTIGEKVHKMKCEATPDLIEKMYEMKDFIAAGYINNRLSASTDPQKRSYFKVLDVEEV